MLRFKGSLNSAVMVAFKGTPLTLDAGLTRSTVGAVTSTSVTAKPPATVRTCVPVVMTTSRRPSAAPESIVMLVVSDVGELTTFELTVTPWP